MEIRYDHVSDAMYIRLTDKMVVASRRVTSNLNVDLDEDNQVIGVELASVRAAGIDPLTIAITHVTTAEGVERPNSEAIRQGRIARMDARKRQQLKEIQDAD